MVLGGAADHRRAADIDVFDAGGVIRAARNGRLERVEIDDEQVDLRDVVRQHRRLVLGIAAHRQQAAVHLGVQRLDPAIHHLGEAGEVGHLGDVEPFGDERFARAAGRDEGDAVRREAAREVDEARLVGDGEQRANDGTGVGGHGEPCLSSGSGGVKNRTPAATLDFWSLT